MEQEKYRIKLSKYSGHPRSTYWDVEMWNGRYHTSVRHGVVSLFGEKAAIRAAKRSLRKYEKFVQFDKYYDASGTRIADIKKKIKIDGDIHNNVYEGSAYCVKCKQARNFTGTIRTSDSGRQMAHGNCPICGTKVNRILGKAQK